VTRPIVFLHGFMGSPSDFTRVLDVIVTVNGPRELTCLPLAGHPEIPTTFTATHPTNRQTTSICDTRSDNARFSPPPQPTVFIAEINRLAGLIAQQFSRPIDLVGYSMGGRLALGVTIEHPKLVNRLFLVSSRRGLDSEIERVARRHDDETRANALERDGLDVFLQRWWEQPLFSSLKTLPATLLAQESSRRHQLNASGLAWSLRHLGLGCQPSYATAVRHLRVPVTVITGSLDTKFHALAVELVEQLPNARAVVVKGRGHHLLLEAPEAVGRAIAEERPL
jgi:2-succinyl-6-hydroxy-2,4-cyclohexadiene-1-carboxylate synthase